MAVLPPGARRNPNAPKFVEVNTDYELTTEEIGTLKRHFPECDLNAVPWERVRAKLIASGKATSESALMLDAMTVFEMLRMTEPPNPAPVARASTAPPRFDNVEWQVIRFLHSNWRQGTRVLIDDELKRFLNSINHPEALYTVTERLIHHSLIERTEVRALINTPEREREWLHEAWRTLPALCDVALDAKPMESAIAPAPVQKTPLPAAPSSEAKPVDDETNDARHSTDFASVNWFGTPYTFTTNQAAGVRVLWEAWKNKTPVLGGLTIIEAAGVDRSDERFDLVFRDNPAWGTMIASPSKGRYCLKAPDAAT